MQERYSLRGTKLGIGVNAEATLPRSSSKKGDIFVPASQQLTALGPEEQMRVCDDQFVQMRRPINS